MTATFKDLLRDPEFILLRTDLPAPINDLFVEWCRQCIRDVDPILFDTMCTTRYSPAAKRVTLSHYFHIFLKDYRDYKLDKGTKNAPMVLFLDFLEAFRYSRGQDATGIIPKMACRKMWKLVCKHYKVDYSLLRVALNGKMDSD
jgi:hypothetical protein